MIYEGQKSGLITARPFKEYVAGERASGGGGRVPPGSDGLSPEQFGGDGEEHVVRFKKPGGLAEQIFGKGGGFERLAHSINVAEDIRAPGGWRHVGAFARGELGFRGRGKAEVLGPGKREEILQMRQFPGMANPG